MPTHSIRFADLPELDAAMPSLGTTPGGSIFCGITTNPDGVHCAVVLLPDQGNELDHQQALAWAEELGATLPTRPVAALLFANALDKLRGEWHWTADTEGAHYAWLCHFDSGLQSDELNSFKGSAVAIRLIPLAA